MLVAYFDNKQYELQDKFMSFSLLKFLINMISQLAVELIEVRLILKPVHLQPVFKGLEYFTAGDAPLLMACLMPVFAYFQVRI